MPTPTVANSMFGLIHVVKRCQGLPCRSSTGTRSMPPGSILPADVP